jgi:hypothetical protein
VFNTNFADKLEVRENENKTGKKKAKTKTLELVAVSVGWLEHLLCPYLESLICDDTCTSYSLLITCDP